MKRIDTESRYFNRHAPKASIKGTQHSIALICPSFAYSSNERSRVITVKPYSLAVAAMIRSAGSRGGLPGSREDRRRTSGGKPATSTSGLVKRRSSHFCGESLDLNLPFDASRPISHPVIGDICTGSARSKAASMASTAACCSHADSMIQSAAHVSSNIG
jgi:hypothetical protein